MEMQHQGSLTFHPMFILAFRMTTCRSLTKVTDSTQLNFTFHPAKTCFPRSFSRFPPGVPVLHLIPAPFPPQWHDVSDTIDNIDLHSIHDIQLIVAAFLCHVLDVSPALVADLPQL